jgi:hypothetical protein
MARQLRIEYEGAIYHITASRSQVWGRTKCAPEHPDWTVHATKLKSTRRKIITDSAEGTDSPEIGLLAVVRQ